MGWRQGRGQHKLDSEAVSRATCSQSDERKTRIAAIWIVAFVLFSWRNGGPAYSSVVA